MFFLLWHKLVKHKWCNKVAHFFLKFLLRSCLLFCIEGKIGNVNIQPDSVVKSSFLAQSYDVDDKDKVSNKYLCHFPLLLHLFMNQVNR